MAILFSSYQREREGGEGESGREGGREGGEGTGYSDTNRRHLYPNNSYMGLRPMKESTNEEEHEAFSQRVEEGENAEEHLRRNGATEIDSGDKNNEQH